MKRIALIAALALAPLHASAVYECTTRVVNVLVYRNGMVNVVLAARGDYTVMCNVNADYGSASPATCMMWTAMLQAVKKKNGLVNVYYDGEGSCATLPTYGSSPVPVYIGDVTP